MVSNTAANLVGQPQRDGRADARLVERIIEGALAGVTAAGLREYLAAREENDARDAEYFAEAHAHGEGPEVSRAVRSASRAVSESRRGDPGPGARTFSPPRRLSIVEILETFADAGGIERARNVTRGHEEVIRLRIENLKSEALETLESLAAGGYASKPLSMDEYRALELTRRACVSVLRLNPFPTRRDSYTDERGPRLGEKKGNHRDTETQRDWNDFVPPFPVGEERCPGGVVGGAAAGHVECHAGPGAHHGAGAQHHVACASSHDVRLRSDHATLRVPFAPGSARGSNVVRTSSAKTPPENPMRDIDEHRGREDAPVTIEAPPRCDPPAAPGANSVGTTQTRCARDHSHGQNVRATEAPPGGPFAPGSARGSNVVESPTALTPADHPMRDPDDRRGRDRAPSTTESPPRGDPPAEPGANGVRIEQNRARGRNMRKLPRPTVLGSHPP